MRHSRAGDGVLARAGDVAATGIVRVARTGWRFGASRTLHVLTLAGFVVTAVVFAVVVHIPAFQGVVDGVPFVHKFARVPDEFRHIGNVLLHVERPWTAGPWITGATPEMLWLGEVERFPSHLYYWVSSVPARVLLRLGADYVTVVVALRLLGVAAGVGCLLVLRALLRALGVAPTVTGWSVLALASTGRFVWQSAGVSYDTPSMLLFLVVLLAAVRLASRVTVVWSLTFVAAACAVSVTKYTFLPFVGALLVGLVALLVVRARRGDGVVARAPLVAEVQQRRALVAVLGVLAVLAVVLVVERIGVNLVVHGAVNPSCDVVHSAEECEVFDIYRRNTTVRAEYLAEVAAGVREPQRLDLVSYTPEWLSRYYGSTFFYRGRDSEWQLPWPVAALGGTALTAATLLSLRWARRLLRTPGAALVGATTILYVASVYVFNLRSFLRLDRYYAHSGRYLLPVLGVAVAAALTAGLWSWRRLPLAWRAPVAAGVVALLVGIALTHNPWAAFIPYVDRSTWFTEDARPAMTGLVEVLRPGALD